MSESRQPDLTSQSIVATLMRELDDVIVLIQRPVQQSRAAHPFDVPPSVEPSPALAAMA